MVLVSSFVLHWPLLKRHPTGALCIFGSQYETGRSFFRVTINANLIDLIEYLTCAFNLSSSRWIHLNKFRCLNSQIFQLSQMLLLCPIVRWEEEGKFWEKNPSSSFNYYRRMAWKQLPYWFGNRGRCSPSWTIVSMLLFVNLPPMS